MSDVTASGAAMLTTVSEGEDPPNCRLSRGALLKSTNVSRMRVPRKLPHGVAFLEHVWGSGGHTGL
jgi:hypothetical protein